MQHSCCVLPTSYWYTLTESQTAEAGLEGAFGWSSGCGVCQQSAASEELKLRLEIPFYGMLHAEEMNVIFGVSDWVSTPIYGIQAPRENLEDSVAKE